MKKGNGFISQRNSGRLFWLLRLKRLVRSVLFAASCAIQGCRISEALALTAKSIDLSAKVIVIESLKKRKAGVHRQVPVPPELLNTLDMVHGMKFTEWTRDDRLRHPVFLRIRADKKADELVR